MVEKIDEQTVLQQLKILQPHLSHPIYVACSGGVDSTVLLHLLWRHRRELGGEVRALHVYHGLSATDDESVRAVRIFCQERNIILLVHHARVSRHITSGVEATARLIRYQAFGIVAPATVVTAHHSDDSVETVLLNLFRGAGLRGVCGIASQYAHGDIHVLRPLLVWSAQRVLEYAVAHRLHWFEDPSNQDMQYRRNWVRTQLLPLIKEKWPCAAKSVMRFAGHMRRTQDISSARARCDEEIVAGEYGGWSREKLRSLGPTRVIEMIQRYLHHHNVPSPPTVRLEEWVRQIFQAQRAVAAVWYHESMQCALTTGTFWLVPKLMPVDQHFQQHVWQMGEESICWPYVGGTVTIRMSPGQGLSLRLLQAHDVSVAVRTPGMKMVRAQNRPRQLVKHLLREANIPNWLRAGWPIVMVGGAVAAVLNVCVASHWQARADEEGVVWTAHPLEKVHS